jgi:hypothetical protein
MAQTTGAVAMIGSSILRQILFRSPPPPPPPDRGGVTIDKISDALLLTDPLRAKIRRGGHPGRHGGESARAVYLGSGAIRHRASAVPGEHLHDVHLAEFRRFFDTPASRRSRWRASPATTVASAVASA